MKPFAYVRPATREEALALLSPTARPKGGGFDLLDLAKAGVSSPDTMVHLAAFQSTGAVDLDGDGVPHALIDPGITLAGLAGNGIVKEHCPAVSDAAGEAATPQVRNVATLAGNLLQRPRCVYFRDPFFDCLKRGGKTCPALEGNHAEAAIFGNGKCCAVHPSNLAAALAALGASVRLVSLLEGKVQERWVCVDEKFFVTPEEDPLREARLSPGDLIDAVSIPANRASAYVEVNQKQSFDWASASCAVALKMEGGKVKEARVVLGAVAPVPWLATEAGEALKGRVPDEAAAKAAAEAAMKGATPLRDNGHKVAQVRAVVRRAVLKAAERAK